MDYIDFFIEKFLEFVGRLSLFFLLPFSNFVNVFCFFVLNKALSAKDR